MTQQNILVLDHKSVSYTVRQNSRIKNYRVLISPEEGLVYECRRPKDLARAATLLGFHKSWILQTLAKQQKKKAAQKALKQHAQSVLVLGVEKSVEILWQQSRDFYWEDSQKIVLGLTEAYPSPALTGTLSPGAQRQICLWAYPPQCTGRGENLLIQILQERAKRCLPVWLKAIATTHGFTYHSVRVKNMKTQWGSCSPDKRIHLNWKLILAPDWVRNYVLIHELAHTKRMDHSQKFWKIVQDAAPDSQLARRWLKTHSPTLNVTLANQST